MTPRTEPKPAEQQPEKPGMRIRNATKSENAAEMTAWYLDDKDASSNVQSVVVTQMTQLYSGSSYMRLTV